MEAPLTEDQRAWLRARIQALHSKQKTVGPYRQAGIQLTIDSMKDQLQSGIWKKKETTK